MKSAPAAILEKAIQKAVNNGWNPIWGQPHTPRLQDCKNDLLITTNISKGTQLDSDITIYWKSKGSLLYDASLYWTIFNHDFAKALWGERKAGDEYLGQPMIREGWQYRLQQMAIADYPIKYLGEYLNESETTD